MEEKMPEQIGGDRDMHDRDIEAIEEYKNRTISLLEGLDFNVSKRPEGQEFGCFTDQCSDVDKNVDIREVELEPSGYYTVGEYVATLAIGEHTITVAFTPHSRDLDAGIFLDKKYIGANHDFNESELLGTIFMAMAVAKFNTSLQTLPTSTKEYEAFERDFNKKVKELRDKR
jgi:hypothetical protein